MEDTFNEEVLHLNKESPDEIKVKLPELKTCDEGKWKYISSESPMVIRRIYITTVYKALQSDKKFTYLMKAGDKMDKRLDAIKKRSVSFRSGSVISKDILQKIPSGGAASLATAGSPFGHLVTKESFYVPSGGSSNSNPNNGKSSLSSAVGRESFYRFNKDRASNTKDPLLASPPMLNTNNINNEIAYDGNNKSSVSNMNKDSLKPIGTPRASYDYKRQSEAELMVKLMLDLDSNKIESIKHYFDTNDNVDMNEFIRIMRAHLDEHVIKQSNNNKIDRGSNASFYVNNADSSNSSSSHISAYKSTYNMKRGLLGGGLGETISNNINTNSNTAQGSQSDQHARHHGITCSEAQLMSSLIELFREIDVNGDGTMEWDEFTRYLAEKALVEDGTPFIMKPRQDFFPVANVFGSKHNNYIDKVFSIPCRDEIVVLVSYSLSYFVLRMYIICILVM